MESHTGVPRCIEYRLARETIRHGARLLPALTLLVSSLWAQSASMITIPPSLSGPSIFDTAKHVFLPVRAVTPVRHRPQTVAARA